MTSHLRLHDYVIEHAVMGMGGGPECARNERGGGGVPRWRKLAQYAVGHTLNEYYSLTPDVRRETPVQFLLERRWPPGDSFPSALHAWDVKNTVADSLVRLVSANHVGEVPFMRYEQWHVPVAQLGMELSVIFQLAWHSAAPGRSLCIQKFMVGGTREVALGFLHMANVFCRTAYGLPPESVEIFNLLDGSSERYDGEAVPWQESLDYIRLLAPFMEEEREPGTAAASCSRH